jgi:hypothetical protein
VEMHLCGYMDTDSIFRGEVLKLVGAGNWPSE